VKYLILKPATSATSSFTAKFDLQDLRCYAVQAVFSGADVAGTFKLQKSVDGTNFVDVTGKSTSVTSSATAVQDDEANYRWLQVSWTYSSGTGNITLYLAVKENPPLVNN
jgi:hypothetical protein